MKYIIDVPNQDYSYDKILHTLKLKFYDDNLSCEVLLDAEPHTEPDRKAIEDEVWRFLVFLIDEMDVDDKYNCFNQSSAYRIASTMSYKEAKSKYEAWLKQKDEIHYGDEVMSVEDDVKAVMLDWADYESIYVMTEHGCVERWKDLDGVKKTGRHFPEVAQLLEKMRRETISDGDE